MINERLLRPRGAPARALRRELGEAPGAGLAGAVWLPLAAVGVVVAVVAVFLGVRGRTPSISERRPGAAWRSPPPAPAAELDRAASILRLRLGAMFYGASTSPAPATRSSRQRRWGVARRRSKRWRLPGVSRIYDWEASVLTPDGQTVASQLAAQNPSAIEISQGSGAQRLPVARRPVALTLYQRRLAGGAAGGTRPRRSTTCSGAARGTACSPALRPRRTQLPAGVRGQALAVPRGVVVLQAAAPSFGRAPARPIPRRGSSSCAARPRSPRTRAHRRARSARRERTAGCAVRLHPGGRAVRSARSPPRWRGAVRR